MKEKQILNSIYVVSTLVFVAVIVLFNLPKVENMPEWVKVLPKINAVLNSICTVLLIGSLIMIKQKNIAAHRKLNIAAFTVSAMFLVTYVLFHAFGVETKYPPEAPFRTLYFFILISHIILAATVLPLVLVTFYRGLNMQVPLHKKIARITMPIWLYVTITGVIVYLMISPYYQF